MLLLAPFWLWTRFLQNNNFSGTIPGALLSKKNHSSGTFNFMYVSDHEVLHWVLNNRPIWYFFWIFACVGTTIRAHQSRMQNDHSLIHIALTGMLPKFYELVMQIYTCVFEVHKCWKVLFISQPKWNKILILWVEN